MPVRRDGNWLRRATTSKAMVLVVREGPSCTFATRGWPPATKVFRTQVRGRLHQGDADPKPAGLPPGRCSRGSRPAQCPALSQNAANAPRPLFVDDVDD